MKHPAELALHQYMEDAVAGKTTMSAETIEQVASDIKDALQRQFSSMGRSGDFRLRMSNIGRPSCQLWYEKNKPEVATPLPTTFIMNMMLGDIVEAVFKGLLKEAGVKYEDSKKVTLELSDTNVSGTYDIVIGDAVDDIKSASDWSFRNKFESYETLASSDGFGYVAQLAGYARASGKQVGGWWVVNKANGDFKYVPAKWMDVDKEIQKVEDTVAKLILNKNCTFCSYRFDCWPEMKELPAVKSKAKEPKLVPYIKLAEEYDAA